MIHTSLARSGQNLNPEMLRIMDFFKLDLSVFRVQTFFFEHIVDVPLNRSDG